MAGEDPGVGTLSVVLELIQRAGSAVTGTIKNTISFGLDVIKTGMFFSWRRQMMQSQKGPQLEHGQQSLRDLRLHEQVGAQIVSVEIGDYKSMDALCQELRRLEIDFAVTEHDYQYTLHYKSNNERDVMLAQAMAMQKLYGDPVQETPDTPAPEKDEQESRQEELERQNQEEQQRQEQERQDQEQQNQNLNQDWTQDWQPDWEQDQQSRGQSGPRQHEGATASEQVQPEGMDHERGRADQRESIGAAAAGRTMSQPLTAYSAARAVPVDELTQKLQQMKDRSEGHGLSEQQIQRVERMLENLGSPNRGDPSLTRSAFERGDPSSLDELKRQAKERARTRNLARKARGRDINRSRSMTRTRHRGLELGH